MQAQRASIPRGSPRMASEVTTRACGTERKWASELLKQLVKAQRHQGRRQAAVRSPAWYKTRARELLTRASRLGDWNQ
jgi:hypothetical protein